MNNGVENVMIYESHCYEGVDDRFAAILSNPPIRAGKKVVHAIIEEAKEYLVENGELWIVIQKSKALHPLKKRWNKCTEIVKWLIEIKGILS